MGHEPVRTCIACRGSFTKNDVVRIVAASGGVVVDYREKLPGRGAYVCPRPECIRKALSREGLSRALHTARLTLPSPEEFIARLAAGITEKIRSLVTMSAKAGRLVAGYSAVRDALGKGSVFVLICAHDFQTGRKKKCCFRMKLSGCAGQRSLPRTNWGRCSAAKRSGSWVSRTKGLPKRSGKRRSD